MSDQKYPHRLVKVLGMGDLEEQVRELTGGDTLALARKDQNAQRRRLHGMRENPQIEEHDGSLRMSWSAADGRNYEATLVGLDYNKGLAVVTDVTSERPPMSPYQKFRARYGGWW